MKLFSKSFLLFLLTVGAIKAFAEPMYIQFNDMIKQSKTIVMGTYLGFNGKTAYESNEYYFKVYETIKGVTTADTLILGRAHGCVQLGVGTNCIAFINYANGFEWVGTTKAISQTMDNTLLFIEGFYDWNAYIVAPATITIGQLKEYIKTESYAGSIEGDLHFFSNATKKMEPSPIHIEVTYSYKDNVLTNSVNMTGVNLNDFSKKAVFNLPFWDNIVTIEYESNGYRPFKIQGKLLDGQSTSNKCKAMFWLEEPEELTYDECKEFIDNPGNGHVYFELELKTGNNKIYTIRLNDEMGRIGKLLQYNGKDLPISSLSTAPTREIVFTQSENELVLKLDSTQIEKSELEFAGDDLIRELKFGSISGTIYIKNDYADLFISSCTLSYKATKFAKNPNYK